MSSIKLSFPGGVSQDEQKYQLGSGCKGCIPHRAHSQSSFPHPPRGCWHPPPVWSVHSPLCSVAVPGMLIPSALFFFRQRQMELVQGLWAVKSGWRGGADLGWVGCSFPCPGILFQKLLPASLSIHSPQPSALRLVQSPFRDSSQVLGERGSWSFHDVTGQGFSVYHDSTIPDQGPGGRISGRGRGPKEARLECLSLGNLMQPVRSPRLAFPDPNKS